MIAIILALYFVISREIDKTQILNMNRFLIVVLATIMFGCSDFSSLNSIDREKQELELALPLVNTVFSVSDFTSEEDDDVSIVVDEEDRVTLVYKGDVVRQNVSAVFPSVPFFAFPLLDTVFNAPVPFASDQRVDKAIFGKTNMIFEFNSDFEEDVTVHVTIPQLNKDGVVFETDFLVTYDGEAPTKFTSDLIPIEDWTLEATNNIITINYDARTPDGMRQKFTSAALAFDVVIFDYVEGYFGSEVFDINGDFIAIGVLDKWRSGGLEFEDPKVRVFVENAFGFPVRSIFKTMQVITTTGEKLDMVSDVIDDNVDFDYPTLDEQGEIKVTEFSFTKDNSNIVDLFKEKVVQVTYDIDAGANPDMDESITGFVNEDSYFLVSVDVALPLHGSVNNLVLQDSIDLDLSDLADANSAEFKNVITNDFPADITLQAYFFDEEGELLDSLFNKRLFLSAAQVDPSSGKALAGEETISYEEIDTTRFTNLASGRKALINVKINTKQALNGPLWIYNDYGIKFKLGAKLKTTI